MIKIVKRIIYCIYKFLLNINICKPVIIIAVDGGICSQMHQYLLSEIFRRRGINVEYDLTFFKYFGKDINGNHARLFDLEKAFPYIKLKKASEYKISLYKKLFPYIGNYPHGNSLSWCNITPPRIMLGYYADPDYLYTQLYNEVFKVDPSILDTNNLDLYNQIRKQNSIAVHVRRGDLSTYVEAYGNPVTLDYFRKSILYFSEIFNDASFYFFSDDKEYVAKQLLPILPPSIKTNIVNNNPEKGYLDLFLISGCKHYITSKGSLGKFGALLGMSKDSKIIVSKDDEQTFMLNNSKAEILAI